MSATRWYLAGPMSGYPQFNFPMFDAVAKGLRSLGFDVISPAELDDPQTRLEALASSDGNPIGVHGTWGDFLARDVKIVADQVQGIILLPHWEKSRGARLEAFVGILCGHEFKTVCPLTVDGVMTQFALYPGDPKLVLATLAKAPDTIELYREWLNERWGPADISDTKRVAITALGLAGETGEVVEHFKKFLRDDTPLHSKDLLLELGDQLHYWMRCVELAGFTPAEVIEANKTKLIERDKLKEAMREQHSGVLA